MKHAKFFLRTVTGLAVALMLGSAQTQTYAGETSDNHVTQYRNDYPEIIQGTTDDLQRQGTSYPSSYDPRNTGMVTSVKNQGSYNTCWAFAMTSAAESNLIKNGFADSSLDLSENHLAYFLYNRKTDSLRYTKNDFNKAKYSTWLDNGGNNLMTGLFLMTWSGMTTESNSAYATTPDVSLAYSSQYVADDIYYSEYSEDAVKEAILNYGAVATDFYIEDSYLNSTGAYYCDRDIDSNHAISIVGWDDNYSRSNFSAYVRPHNDGAWIVKNSYGSGYGDDGYLYVSYEDKSIGYLTAVNMEKRSDAYDNNYQHDGSSSANEQMIAASGINRVANVFKVKAANGYNETLKAVSVCSYSSSARYYLQIYAGLADSNDPESGTPMFEKEQTGILKNAGYTQIVLDKPVTMAAGENFAVVMRFSTNEQVFSLGIDKSTDYEWVEFDAYTGSRKSFMSRGNSWFDYGEYADAVFRIKAYTDNTDKKAVAPGKVSGLKLKGGTGKVKISWNKVSGAKGYMVMYSTSKNGTYKKLKKVSGNTITSCTKKLSGGTYYVKVCAYKRVGSHNRYGEFTCAKKVNVRNGG